MKNEIVFEAKNNIVKITRYRNTRQVSKVQCWLFVYINYSCDDDKVFCKLSLNFETFCDNGK